MKKFWRGKQESKIFFSTFGEKEVTVGCVGVSFLRRWILRGL